jgi:thiol-disulfide isomerase/thioredoxin
MAHLTLRRRARRVVLGLAASTALVASACSTASSVETGERPDLPVAPAASDVLPAVTVWDVGAQEWVQFANLLPSDRPLLVWFWAPHCPACAREAPEMVAFAEEWEGKVDVVGLGTQDDAAMAQTFVDRHDIGFPMLWDESFESWVAFGVNAQPATVLFSGDGEPLGGWLGPMPTPEVEALLA